MKKIFILLLAIQILSLGCSENIYKRQHIKLINDRISSLLDEKSDIKDLFMLIMQDLDKENDTKREVARYHWDLLFSKIEICNTKNALIIDNILIRNDTIKFITSSRTANTQIFTHYLQNQVEMEFYIDRLLLTELEVLISGLEAHASEKIDIIVKNLQDYVNILQEE